MSDIPPSDHLSSINIIRHLNPPSNETLKPRPKYDPAAQAAKREILTNLRDDWIWPVSPSHSPAPLRIPPTTQWCERLSGSSSPSSSSPSPSHASSPYKYENPDAVAAPVVTRKRKRYRRLRNECLWNEGLAVYIQRRDAWTGACAYQQGCHHHHYHHQPTRHISLGGNFLDADPDADPSTPRFSSPSPPPPLLPLPPPLLSASNPIRASITPSTYPTIFSKVVIQGLAPTVPINLSDIVKALVQGWKDQGEWPPKPVEENAPLERRDLGKRDDDAEGVLARRGVSRVKRGLGRVDDGGGETGEGRMN